MHSLLCVVSFERQPSMNNSHPDIHISGNYRKEKKNKQKLKAEKGHSRQTVWRAKLYWLTKWLSGLDFK